VSQEVLEGWDSEVVRRAVIASKKSRHTLQAAMAANSAGGEHWDYNPPSEASEQYVRNHMDWTVAAARYRFPPFVEN